MNLFTADQIRGTDLADARGMIQHNLVSDRWAIRGLLAIYSRQTADEQSSEGTKHHNGVGFNGSDAPILSSLAKQVLRWEATPVWQRPYSSPLSGKQLLLLRRKLVKYSGQLARIAKGE